MARRRKSDSEGLLVLGALLVMGLAAIWIYLVVIGAAVFIGWLITKAIQASVTRRAHAPTPKLVVAEPVAPSRALLPSEEYRELVPIKPEVFDDVVTTEAAAIEVFTAWGRRLPSAPRDVDKFLQGLQLRTRLVGRLVSTIDGRRLVWRKSPYGGRDSVGAPPLRLDAVDPWNPPSSLRGDSRFIESCATCRGSAEVSCPSCGGSTRLTCQECRGVGKQYGYAKNGSRRLLNCKSCKGKGTLKCDACKRGMVGCGTCHATGKLECWAEIEESRRDDVQVEPDGDVTKAFRWGRDGVAAPRDEVAADARIVAEVQRDRAIAASDVLETVGADWIRANWEALQPTVGRGERVTRQLFEFLEIPAVEVTYGIGDEASVVEFAGRRFLAPPVSADDLFASRARTLRNVGLGLAALPSAAAVFYACRGPYFLQPAIIVAVLGLCVSAGAGFAVLWGASLLRPWTRPAAFAAIVPLVVGIACAFIAEPRVAHARRSFEAGLLADARAELLALGPPDDARNAGAWADLHVKELRAGGTLAEMESALSRIPASAPQQETARALFDELLLSAAQGDLEANDAKGARQLFERVRAPRRAMENAPALSAQISLAVAESCIDAHDWSCASSELLAAMPAQLAEMPPVRDLFIAGLSDDAEKANKAVSTARSSDKRIELEKQAEILWQLLVSVEPAQFRAKLDAASRLRKNEEQAVKRARAAQKRAAKPLKCCDGSVSASCTCGDNGPGCCMHNGGVCDDGCQ